MCIQYAGAVGCICHRIFISAVLHARNNNTRTGIIHLKFAAFNPAWFDDIFCALQKCRNPIDLFRWSPPCHKLFKSRKAEFDSLFLEHINASKGNMELFLRISHAVLRSCTIASEYIDFKCPLTWQTYHSDMSSTSTARKCIQLYLPPRIWQTQYSVEIIVGMRWNISTRWMRWWIYNILCKY